MPLLRLTSVAQPGGFDDYALDDDDFICDPATGLPLGGWSNQGTVVNKIDIKFNWNEMTQRNEFGARQLYSGTTSVTRYSPQPALTLETRGVHLSLGGQTTLNRFAVLFLQRWGYPPPILLCSVPYRRHLFQALDTLLVTCSKIPNLITGAFGIEHERFEVITVNARWGTQGRLDLALLWVSAIETSAVPVPSDALTLTPGTSTVDATDVDVPFSSSADVTTPVICRKIRIGLKSQNYRIWRTLYDVFGGQADKPNPPICVAQGQAYDELNYNSRIQYHLDYKTAVAPNSPGIGVDPSTGWVPFVAATERGNTALFATAGCNGVAAVPGEDVWTDFRDEILPGSPDDDRLHRGHHMSVILDDRPTITINAPADPELAKLWDLAIAKVEARFGEPRTKAAWNQVTREYNALTTKTHGAMSQIIRERCDKAPGYD